MPPLRLGDDGVDDAVGSEPTTTSVPLERGRSTGLATPDDRPLDDPDLRSIEPDAPISLELLAKLADFLLVSCYVCNITD